MFAFSCGSKNTNSQSTKTKKSTEQITQQPETVLDTILTADPYYNQAYNEIVRMLEGDQPLDFKRAAFLSEWAYTNGALNYQVFCDQIAKIGNHLQTFIRQKGVSQYKTAGNYALFEFFTKPNWMNQQQPYVYDFRDFYGREDYRNVFVTKLLETHKGQCRSMPMLYKILADEIGAKCHLAFGPNHLYIKHLDEQGKWVNIELTNGHFSTDSWMISSMDISVESIRSGIYMKALDEKESIAFCLNELSVAYEKSYGYDTVMLAMNNKVLEHFPNCIQALIHKSNTLRHIGLEHIKRHGKKKTPYLVNNHREFKKVEAQMTAYGFRKMSPSQYQEWVKSMEKERQKRKHNFKNLNAKK